ncbi:MAG: hypothetical protein M1360_04505 [Candidatus Marsarchaeota archaeon]|jgi:hypothetical protein|nr:hypothetical protein [Candidatus Marsarchaeota archaeon]MCL5419167.1 hypothetical protein [Candidatus Marsarchaeota archaeon]
MYTYEVIEHRQKGNGVANGNAGNAAGNGKNFFIKAINFTAPTCIIFSSTIECQFDSKVQNDGTKEVYLDGKVVGEIIKRQDNNDIKVNSDYDIKYTGGYSKDGKTIYIDRDLPKAIAIEGKTIDLVMSIAIHHELVEKWLIDDAYDYQYAHTIATKIEREYVESLGIKWESYDSAVGNELRRIFSKRLSKSPRDLDLSPYVATNDQDALKEIRESIEF